MRIRYSWVLFVAAVVMVASCRKQQRPEFVMAERDTTITVENAFSELFLDSAAVAHFVADTTLHDSLAIRIRSFYNSRNYQFAWFFPEGMAAYVHTFLNMQQQFIHYSGDSTLFDPDLDQRIETLGSRRQISPEDTAVIEAELLLTRQFFRYAYYAYSGDRDVNLQDLGWFIPRRKLDMVSFLDSLLANKGGKVEWYEPVNRQYNLLKKHLLEFSELETAPEWEEELMAGKRPYKTGESAAVAPVVRKRLALLGYPVPEEPDTLTVITAGLANAVKSFQKHYGLTEDGVLGAAVFRELNVPPAARMKQLLINMERMRWMQENPETDYLLVNIPEFRLHVYEQGKLAFDMDVVVGSVAHSTVIFSGVLDQVVFSPYWNVPASILKNEILPAIARNPNYLARHRMEWNGNSVRQLPGPGNSLGQVKFLFPNSYNIYLHDTPSKSLFGESKRAFSHGCIRLSEPKKLAEFLLRKDSTWTPEKIAGAMQAGKEKYVRLKNEDQVPVIIGYFTAWVDKEGALNFRNDVYGHDQQMMRRYFAGSDLNGPSRL